MDYEFEAPKYVNFASAMEEDDEDVSKYFEVEHEHSLRNLSLRCTPQAVLPKGIRTYSSASKQNKGSTQNSSQKSEQPAGVSNQTQQALKQDSLPAQSPTNRRLTRSSLSGISPLPPTPKANTEPLTPGVKRTRPSIEESSEATPSKKLKSTPGIVIKALADIQLSPTLGLDAKALVQEAFHTLKHLSKSARKQPKSPGSRLSSVVDGINVELKQDKEHTMETRGDKQQRNQPLHLRSRSVPRSNTRTSQQSSPGKAKPEIRTRVRARSASKDRIVTADKRKTETDRFVSLAEAIGKLQTKTPPRFRIRKNSPSKMKSGPLKPMRPTIPQSPAFQSRIRNRTAAFIAKEKGVQTSSTNARKSNGVPPNVLKPHNTVEKKSPTVPQPFKLTEVKKKGVSPAPQAFTFTARPAPQSTDKKGLTPTSNNKAKTPSKVNTPLRKFVTVIEERNGERALKEKEVPFSGLTFVPKKQTTETKPFSFEVREQERLARKAARLQEKIEAEIKGQPKFHANPLPVFKTPPRLKRSPSPMTRKPITANGIDSKPAEKTAKDGSVPAVKAPLGPTFRARQPVVLNKKPFEPVKPQRQLPLPAVVLNSDLRAKERLEYEKKQAERDAEIKAIVERQKEEQERREQEVLGKLRKETVHKARPVPEVKPFETQPSDKPLTDPKTPFCLKRSVLTAR